MVAHRAERASPGLRQVPRTQGWLTRAATTSACDETPCDHHAALAMSWQLSTLHRQATDWTAFAAMGDLITKAIGKLRANTSSRPAQAQANDRHANPPVQTVTKRATEGLDPHIAGPIRCVSAQPAHKRHRSPLTLPRS